MHIMKYELIIRTFKNGGDSMRVNALKMQILMGKKNLTIKELAYKSAVSRQTISCIKAGKSCSPQVAYKLSQALDIDMQELLE